MLKKKLLDTGYFIDNTYLDSYVELVKNPSRSELAKYTDRHHILPRAYFKLAELPIDNSKDNLVRLSFLQHCKAHWLLYFCTQDNLKYAMQTAFVIMVDGLKKHIGEYTEADFKELQELKALVYKDSKTFWSEADDVFLKTHFNKLSDEELAAKLNRTVIAVQARRSYFGLQRFTMSDFSKEEVDYIISNFETKEIKEIAEVLGRSVGSIAQKCHRLGLRKKAEPWTAEDLAFLRTHAKDMSLSELSQKLNRSKLSISHHCHIHNIKCQRTDLWLETEDQYLRDNYATHTCSQMAKILNRSVSAVSRRCQRLKLSKKYL